MAISKNSHPDIQYVPTTTRLRTIPGPPVGDNAGNPFSPLSPANPHLIFNNGQMPMYPTEGLINLFSPSPNNDPAQQFVDIKWYYPKSSTQQYPPYNTLELEGIVFQSAAASAQFFGKFTFVWDYFGGIPSTHLTRPDVETYAGTTSYFDIATSYGEFLHSDVGANSDFSYYRVFLQADTNGYLQINFKYTFI